MRQKIEAYQRGEAMLNVAFHPGLVLATAAE
jgi:hypothetical protein